MRALALVVLVSACGRLDFDPVAPPTVTGGARLEPIHFTSDVGGDLFAGWYDTALDTECAFGQASDGRLRCLPTGGSGPLYTDAACSQPVATVEDGCLDARYFTDQSGAVYALDTPISPTQLFSAEGVTCVQAQVTTAPYYRLGAPLPSAGFVGATEQIVPAGRLSYVEDVADDGSRQRLDDLIDTATGTRCRIREIDPHEGACTPSIPAGLAGFLDAGCTIPVVIARTDVTGQVVVGTPTVCNDNLELITLGAKESVQMYYQQVAMTCTPSMLGAGYTLFDVAATSTFDVFAAAIEIGTATGRLGSFQWQTADGVTLPESLWDAALAAPCAPVEIGGALVCAPASPSFVFDLSASSMCTNAIAGIPSCRAALSSYAEQTLNDCTLYGADVTIYDVPVPGPLWAEDPSGACTALPPGVTVQMLDPAPTTAASFVPLRRERVP